MKLSEISSKDVISDFDGMKLGKISDYTIDKESGKIQSIHISGGNGILNLFQAKETKVLAWNKILKIGNDVIIIDNTNIKTND